MNVMFPVVSESCTWMIAFGALAVFLGMVTFQLIISMRFGAVPVNL